MRTYCKKNTRRAKKMGLERDPIMRRSVNNFKNRKAALSAKEA